MKERMKQIMNAQEKMRLLQCIAHAQIKDGDEKSLQRAEVIAGWINDDTLGAIVTPEEISQANRLSEYELLYFPKEPFVILQEEQNELIQWMQELTKSELLNKKGKTQIKEAVQLLEDCWSAGK